GRGRDSGRDARSTRRGRAREHDADPGRRADARRGRRRNRSRGKAGRRRHHARRGIDWDRTRTADRGIDEMSPVAAVNADKRFRRAQVKPSRKRRAWRAVVRPILVYAGATCALAYALFRTTVIVAHAHVLQVDRIVVHGNERLSKGDVLAVMSGLRGESLLWTDLDRWRKRLL